MRSRGLCQSTFGDMAVDCGRLGYDRIAVISGEIVMDVWSMYFLLSATWTLQRFHTVACQHYLRTYWYMHLSGIVLYMLCCKTDGMLWWWQGEMKAFCEICNLHFVSDADLNRHNRYHHMSKYDGTAEERTFLSATAELTTTTAHRHISLRPQQVNKWLISQLVIYFIECG